MHRVWYNELAKVVCGYFYFDYLDGTSALSHRALMAHTKGTSHDRGGACGWAASSAHSGDRGRGPVLACRSFRGPSSRTGWSMGWPAVSAQFRHKFNDFINVFVFMENMLPASTH